MEFNQFWGNLPFKPIIWLLFEYHPGVIGFTGIHFEWKFLEGSSAPSYPEESSYYLETVLLADISS